MTTNRHAASFRDPSGYIFERDGVLLRQVNPIYLPQYHALKQSGFYRKLIENKLLISHQEVQADAQGAVIKPEQISFFSYPYEWSFEQYKHAALHTLKLQKYCLQNGWTLKDATAFNITFHKGAPVFVDTLSFDPYQEGEPWRAYRQFLTHFLCPLVLTKYFGTEHLQSLLSHIDGMPLQQTAKLLPFSARLSPVLYTNIFLAAKFDTKYSGDREKSEKKVTISKSAQMRIVDSLYDYIKDLTLRERTQWKDYYTFTNYEARAFDYKKDLVKKWFDAIGVRKIIDLGGNDGTFSRVLKDTATEIIVADIDPNAVGQNYNQVLQNKEQNILPLVCDLLNPSPGIGLNNKERTSLLERFRDGGFELSMALALIHHISLTGNVPFEMSAKLFASFSPYLIIEFPDREDSWVAFLLKSKRDFVGHFDHYNMASFEHAYAAHFDTVEKQKIPDTHRTMYLLKRKS